ncbi:VOC family protein [Thermophilibacter immobilis]|jgi:lactoylglutathione lyase|uniref:VOC family protein n=1 Tax=Thermophilibacter immobilis TaxID=2779519 RepID=A0A7S7RUC6_9ACTN|nr:VOC family protein [Thermophilibacter immobilis]QOY60317.1 VOC family protein [Thermophilibacter immobilis]
MHIEHAALYVRDLKGARDFFVRYFEAVVGPLYHNPRMGFRSYFLSLDEGARLELMCRPELADGEKDLLQVGWAHLAVSLGSPDEVNRLTAHLAADGYEVTSGPRTTGDGYYESCVLGPEDIPIELTV